MYPNGLRRKGNLSVGICSSEILIYEMNNIINKNKNKDMKKNYFVRPDALGEEIQSITNPESNEFALNLDLPKIEIVESENPAPDNNIHLQYFG